MNVYSKNKDGTHVVDVFGAIIIFSMTVCLLLGAYAGFRWVGSWEF